MNFWYQQKMETLALESSNSTVFNFVFNSQSKAISFKHPKGKTGTRGISDIVVPKSLLGGQVKVLIDGNIEPYNSDGVVVISDTPETAFKINYHHSMYTIHLVGTGAAEMPLLARQCQNLALWLLLY